MLRTILTFTAIAVFAFTVACTQPADEVVIDPKDDVNASSFIDADEGVFFIQGDTIEGYQYPMVCVKMQNAGYYLDPDMEAFYTFVPSMDTPVYNTPIWILLGVDKPEFTIACLEESVTDEAHLSFLVSESERCLDGTLDRDDPHCLVNLNRFPAQDGVDCNDQNICGTCTVVRSGSGDGDNKIVNGGNACTNSWVDVNF